MNKILKRITILAGIFLVAVGVYFITSLNRMNQSETVYTAMDGDVYVLSGKQLLKIFNSTNFNDMGSLRYLYKYIEKSGAIDKLIQMGLDEGDTISIEDYEFEYYPE